MEQEDKLTRESESNNPGTQSGTDANSGSPLPVEGANELRRLAAAFEVLASENLSGLAGLSVPISTGNLRDFPRPALEFRVAERGLEYLREAVERTSAILETLATAREKGVDVSPVLLAAVGPFIAALRTELSAPDTGSAIGNASRTASQSAERPPEPTVL